MRGFRILLPFLAAAAMAQQMPFVSIPPPARDTLRFGEKLPDFEARDTSGRVWRPADLLGKYTVVDLWVANYGMANAEHPELERLYEQLKTNKANIQVLTFCLDLDYTHAPAYMRARHYTFPVIADWKVGMKLFGNGGGIVGGVPQQRVIDPERRLAEPFHNWSAGRVLFEVERAAARK
ncbi:MAG: redoxin domain-containing protein [Acidobacteria bacterium]|nr:redoxin domain-containing protein [Acidobacteriota bacterium]